MKKPIVILFAALLLVWGGALYLLIADPFGTPSENKNTNASNTNTGIVVKSEKLKQFASAQEFKEYLLKSSEESGYGFLSAGTTANVIDGSVGLGEADLRAPTESIAKEISRVSETNVQVKYIDEPDIIKTDGEDIYFSSEQSYYRSLMMEETISDVSPYPENKTKVIGAFPPANLSQKTEINKTGNLLLENDILVIFSGDTIYGYSVADSSAPDESWKIELDSNSSVVSARLYNNKIYLVTKTNVSYDKPCPIKPLVYGGTSLEIACSDIHYPQTEIPVDVTYTASVFNPQSGKVEKSVSFVGNTDSAVVYMSPNALYTTYSFVGDIVEYFYKFFAEEGKDLVSSSVLQKLDKLRGYELSSMAKIYELQAILTQYWATLGEDKMMQMANEMENRLSDFAQSNQRTLTRTGIIKVSLDEMNIEATGEIPGYPLNQFSLDEYDGNLRIATTVGGSLGFFGGSGGEEVNDVYVLDKDLKLLSSVLDLGKGETIYSVRFIEDKGYVVTFKQIDPFYVLDLSNPKKPQLKGELKIPGYSSYLHPLATNKILGIGMEGSKVKISVFDVTDPTNPIEKDNYQLDEYWSEISSTHHAFLLDVKHKIFFLPGSKGGYIFSYDNDKLSLARTVATSQAKRAVYINDYLYIISEEEIVVLDEKTWEEVKSLKL